MSRHSCEVARAVSIASGYPFQLSFPRRPAFFAMSCVHVTRDSRVDPFLEPAAMTRVADFSSNHSSCPARRTRARMSSAESAGRPFTT